VSLEIDKREWNDLARTDAMWAVCSVPGRRGRWRRDEFFASGASEVAGILEGLQGHGLTPNPQRALDFGCGLGRLTRALSSHFVHVVGVDLSSDMVERARDLNRDRPNCQFVINDSEDLARFPDEDFDFVLSLIALQHVSTESGLKNYIRELVRVTRPGGVLVFQLPRHIGWRIRVRPLRILNRAVRRIVTPPRWWIRLFVQHSMSLRGLPEAEVRDIIARAGGMTVSAWDDGRGDSKAMPSLSYVVVKPP
jgi:SAM-dependent methyltransferase